VDALAFPFRFVANRAVRVDDASEEFAAQMIASIIQTRLGELPITVDFGTVDPVFSVFDEGNLIRTVSNYTENIIIDNVFKKVNADHSISVSVEFSLSEE
jgi:hypothetical protein